MNGIEITLVLLAVCLVLVHSLVQGSRLASANAKLDRVLGALDGLRKYLYEIDPQFDDERASRDALKRGDTVPSGLGDLDLLRRKKEEGRRTLNTPF
jgi:hypothetical protein